MKTSCMGSESETPAVALRRRAEGIARGKTFRIPEGMESLSIEAARQMLHELRVHQIEMGMQNEELRRAQVELDASRARYFDLYDLAPMGYCTLSEQGQILEVNLTAATLLGVARDALVKQPLTRFILKEDQDIYYQHRKQLFETHSPSSGQAGEPQACELRLVKMDGTAFWAHLEATAAQDAGGAPVCRVMLSDITEKRRTNDRERLAREVLDLLNRTETAEDTIHEILAAVKKNMGFDAVAIRLREGDDFPYYSNKGFSEDFVLAERFLCARDYTREIVRDGQGNPVLECMCGNVLCGRYNPALPFFTEGGSFWSNCTTRLLASTTEADCLARTRNRCNSEGYESVALIPLRSDGEIIGLLQLNDHRSDQFTLEMIHFFEGLGTSIKIALSRKLVVKNLCDALDSLRKAVGVTIHVMVSAVETRDPYTAGHQVRSADLARAIATEMGLPPEKIEGIRMAGSIHDIGKLSIPAEILSKPTKLSEIEFSLIKEHARQGYEILRNVESPWPLAEMVYQHHERMDGSGYPRNLKGDEILMEARILAVSDVVESMASHRPYRVGLGIDAALEEIEKNRGTLYDVAVVNACLRVFREKGYRFAER